MKLIKMDDGKIGLFVQLPTGPHAIDIGKSVGVFAHEPLLNGLLNGAFKEGGDWSTIVKNWTTLRPPLHRLAKLASVCPDYSSLVLRPLEEHHTQGAADSILAIEIIDMEEIRSLDPTGRRAMERQFGSHSEEDSAVMPPIAEGAEIIDFLQR